MLASAAPGQKCDQTTECEEVQSETKHTTHLLDVEVQKVHKALRVTHEHGAWDLSIQASLNAVQREKESVVVKRNDATKTSIDQAGSTHI